ncbi:MAG: aminopeptidase [Clostridia bacterium]|nr:aminopeptidase [Clostridia bacterium]
MKDHNQECYELIIERMNLILNEETVQKPYLNYFRSVASFILSLCDLHQKIKDGTYRTLSFKELEAINQALYRDVMPKQYPNSYANPEYATKELGEYGTLLSFLYTEMRATIVDVFENDEENLILYYELFLELYNMFEYENQDGGLPTTKTVKDAIYWFISDTCDITVEKRVKSMLLPEQDFAVSIIQQADLTDLRYLYYFGEYISENELKTAQYLNQLSHEKIDSMAEVYTQGFKIGFIINNKDLSKKEVVNIRYSLGFERVVRAAISKFAQMGLKPVIYRAAVHSINKRGQLKIGYYGAIANKQYEFDHKEDEALYLDRDFVNRKLGVLKVAYEEHKKWANLHAGPAVMEVFGENPFHPEVKKEALHLSEKQQKYAVSYAQKSGQLVNCYIKGEERSFTIIAYPIPEIGADFEQIFDETVKLNTLDYKLYQTMQQTMINALDQAVAVHIVGGNGNHTDLTVKLYSLTDPDKETIFENCVADVNIPVGEVFTSPNLKGTNGTLHVKEVYLEGMKYENLELVFKDGYVTDYRCSNYQDMEENQKLIKDQILFHHDTLPMGEFAIGTNTTAYAMGRKYHIEERLPILIAEKTGPHFAVGDTCYSHCEDLRVFNPDGKEIVAKDNEHSILRKEDPEKAYFQCHTDITIPYDELKELTAIREDQSTIAIIKDKRFVLDGCEILNKPLENM